MNQATASVSVLGESLFFDLEEPLLLCDWLPLLLLGRLSVVGLESLLLGLESLLLDGVVSVLLLLLGLVSVLLEGPVSSLLLGRVSVLLLDGFVSVLLLGLVSLLLDRLPLLLGLDPPVGRLTSSLPLGLVKNTGLIIGI